MTTGRPKRRGTSGGGPNSRSRHRQPQGPGSGVPPARKQFRAAGASLNDERRFEAAEDALEHGRIPEARKWLRPLRDRYEDVAAVRELWGVIAYHNRDWELAEEELATGFVLTGSPIHHAVRMDVARARKDYLAVDRLWRELKDKPTRTDVMVEARIVRACALADQDKLEEALEFAMKGPKRPERVRDHHVRLWYTLGDLEERTGNLPQARRWFKKVTQFDRDNYDARERLSDLG